MKPISCYETAIIFREPGEIASEKEEKEDGNNISSDWIWFLTTTRIGSTKAEERWPQEKSKRKAALVYSTPFNLCTFVLGRILLTQ